MTTFSVPPAYEFISDHEVRLEHRRLLEVEHAKVYFAILAEPDPTKLKDLLADLEAAQARIENLRIDDQERFNEINEILSPPVVEDEPPKKKRLRLRR